MIIVHDINKPENCAYCYFNSSDCWCSITHGEIDRDDYSCDKPCPIEEVEVSQNDR